MCQGYLVCTNVIVLATISTILVHVLMDLVQALSQTDVLNSLSTGDNYNGTYDRHGASNLQQLDTLFNNSFKLTTKKPPKVATCEFPSQSAFNAENVWVPWCHIGFFTYDIRCSSVKTNQRNCIHYHCHSIFRFLSVKPLVCYTLYLQIIKSTTWHINSSAMG